MVLAVDALEFLMNRQGVGRMPAPSVGQKVPVETKDP